MAGALWWWGRRQWQRHWSALVLGALVLAITGTAAIGSAMGARRAPGSYERLRGRTNAADVRLDVIDRSGTALQALIDDPARLATATGASGLAVEEEFFVRPAGSDLIPTFNLHPILERQLLANQINEAIPLAGRMPEPARADEVAINPSLADRLGLHPGDRLVLETATTAWVEQLYSGRDTGPPDGPRLEVTVTAIAIGPADFEGSVGAIVLTPAFGDAARDRIAGFRSAQVRFSDHRRAATVVADGQFHTGDAAIDAGFGVRRSPWGANASVDDGLRIGAAGLWIFAVIALATGSATFALLVRRLGRSVSGELDALGALGLDRRGRHLSAAFTLSPAIVLGGAAGAAGAAIVSPVALFGLARAAEPDRGVFVDWVVLAAGVALVGLMAVLVAAPAFAAVARSARRGGRRAGIIGVRHPIPLALGVRHALGSGTRPVGTGRGTLVACATTMAAVVASLTLGGALVHLVDHPRLWGIPGDAWLDRGERAAGDRDESFDRELDAIAAEGNVASVTGTVIFYPQVAGSDLTVVANETRNGPVALSIVRGRAPLGSDEIALGRATLRRLDVDLGDHLALGLEGVTADFTVVGQALFPFGDFDPFDHGGAVTIEGARRFPGLTDTNRITAAIVSWRPGADVPRALAGFEAAGYDAALVGELVPPSAVANLADVDRLPQLLAIFLGAVGLASMAHALSTSASGRRRDVAILRALGLTVRSSTTIVAWEATTIAVSATAIGIPVGVVAGQLAWTRLADRSGVIVDRAPPWPALAIAVAVAAAGSLLITFVPARLIARAHPATTLRQG